MKPEPLISLHFCETCVITAEEFETILKDISARFISRISEPGDRILAQLIRENSSRYLECRTIKEQS